MKNPICTIYLVRYGESEFNAGSHVAETNPTINSPLTQKGIQQARTLAEKFKDIPFTAAYSSDLIRAIDTAKIIASPHLLKVSSSPLIKERVYLKHNDKALEIQVKKMHDNIVDINNNLSVEEKLKLRVHPEIETGEELMNRTVKLLNKIKTAHPNETVLVVSHGNLMRTFLHYLRFVEPHNLPLSSVQNTGYIKFNFDGKNFNILEINDINIKS